MGLIDIAYLEAVHGEDISTEDEPQAQKYIDIVSAWIVNDTGVLFSPHEDVVVKATADAKGIIEIEDLQEISLIEIRDGRAGTWIDVNSPLYFAFNAGLYGFGYLGGYGFDGISQIYGLCPHATYRITCTHGMEEAPEEIKGIVALLVLAGTGLNAEAINGLMTYRVGDVEESYGVIGGANDPTITLSRLMVSTLNNYSTGNTTYRV